MVRLDAGHWAEKAEPGVWFVWHAGVAQARCRTLRECREWVARQPR